MKPDQDLIEPEEPIKQAEGIDFVTAYCTMLRVVAHLESHEYTTECERQADVVVHNGLPNPASDYCTRQG
jgi:putative hemolysin